MPFTPAHSAIVLPLLRLRWLSATGLIIGSIAPDFEYFFKASVSSVHSHTWGGLFYFDLPVVVALAFVFHLVVKKNLINNSPRFLQVRFQDTLHFNFIKYLKSNWYWFLVSALIGAASHIFWDSFTHNSGYFVHRLPFYRYSLPWQGVKYPMFYVLQHVSTFVGLAAITVYVMLKQRQQIQSARITILYWTLVLIVIAAVVIIRFAVDGWNPHLGNRVVSFISGLCLALILTGFINFRNLTFTNRHGQEDAMGASRKT
ncbi:DUF4184 family protein [Pseudochryseolinea flava]|uniref:DUF4184 domain-containing protein n=1 Tax=Pseudochryseolinea flava TaxID=2059302 RepID=A0A364XV57_9BACT|nr:DUF4184 family protein [Pseudochryseolinea flava]RAV98016.1 DUF4184 domain-containing protein [Pseudochryseolinea flava]